MSDARMGGRGRDGTRREEDSQATASESSEDERDVGDRLTDIVPRPASRVQESWRSSGGKTTEQPQARDSKTTLGAASEPEAVRKIFAER